MTGLQLKNSILQLAIQGKLVPQDPNDEPASVLLEKIRKEKEQLVKDGKLKKKDLEATPISEDEKQFEIPESWEWCRIGDLFLHTSGKQQSSSNKGGGTPQKFITTSNLYWGRFELDAVKVMNFTAEEIKTCSATKGDLLVCEGGAGYGRSAIWDKDYDICLQNHVHRLRPLISGTCEYVLYYLYLLKETNQLAAVGTAMPGLSANRLKGIEIPLPPLAEQQRIVAKIEELLPLIEEYDKAQKELDALNTSLPEALKKSILQEAIQGKLVPQDPNDEPASGLLEKIRKEKEQMVKDGKLKKKDLITTPISDDEKPFEIPESWEWVRWGDVSYNIQYGYNAPALPAGDIRMVRISDIQNGEVQWDTVLFCNINDDERETYLLGKNDILFARTGGTVGKSFLVKEVPYPAVYAGYLIRTQYDSCLLVPEYLKMFMESNLYWRQLRNGTIATAQPNCNGQTLSKMIVPLPPIAEQQRIVAKIEELFKAIDNLKVS